jgi:hypothetical protein
LKAGCVPALSQGAMPAFRPTILCLALALAAAAHAAPALVVVIAVDQFRADYLVRFREHFVPGGFNLLLTQGANFTDCHYRHSVTKTAPGHAVILSGVHADIHGIIANDWIDRGLMRRVNCVDDEREQPVGIAVASNRARLPGVAPLVACSPRNFLATTVGDELKRAAGPRAKVIAISSKDRSAVLLGGKHADAAYWMDKGRLITSTYYMKELPAWARAFNDSGRIEAFFGKTWDRLLPAAVYDAVQGPDDAPGESTELAMGRAFPRQVDGGIAILSPAFYDAFENTPFKSEVLMEFARAVVENENLGGRGVTDLLCVSLSTNDTIGHNYGPDSHEVMDITLRTDRMLADFFKFLDGRVGLKNCTIVLTADHGVSPLPERLKLRDPAADTGRVDNVLVLKTAEAALDRAFGAPANGQHWVTVDGAALLFFPEVLKQKKVAQPAAEKVVREALLTIPFVADAYTRTQLEAREAPGANGPAMLLSFNRARSADVLYVTKPFWFDRKIGTNHGTPYDYDTHVPLLWFGAGVKPGTYPQRVGVDDLAPTLARLLGLSAPSQSQGRVLF